MTTNPDIEDDQIDPINQEERDFLAEFTEAKINELERTAYARSLEPLSEAEIKEIVERWALFGNAFPLCRRKI